MLCHWTILTTVTLVSTN